MELVLIRHGVTAWNQQRRFQGQIDTPLSDEGHQQAMLTARHLSALSEEQPIQAIYASDLKRAWSTAEPIARLLGLPILKQSLLRERHYGVFEGKTHDELQHEGLQSDYQRWRNREPDFALPQGGESLWIFLSGLDEPCSPSWLLISKTSVLWRSLMAVFLTARTASLAAWICQKLASIRCTTQALTALPGMASVFQ